MLSFDVSIESNVTAPDGAPIPLDATSAAAASVERRAARAGLGLAAAGVLTFSFTVPSTKIAVRGLDPLLSAAGRAVVAAVIAGGVLVAERVPLPTRAQLARFAAVIVGVVLGFPLLTAYAVRHVPSSHGVVVIGLLPLATAGFGVVRVGERPSIRYWMCSLVGLAAVVAFVVHEDGLTIRPAHLLLLLAVLVAAMGYTEGALLAREIVPRHVICWALVLALPVTASFSGWSLAREAPNATAGQWIAFAYTAVFSMLLGFFAWYAGMARAGISRSSQLQLAQPALGLLWAWPMLGERPDLFAICTILVVLAAVVAGRRAPVR